MPFKNISDFQKSFSSVKNLSPEQKKKALDVFNTLKKDGMDDGAAVAIAIKRAKNGGENMNERILCTSEAIELDETGKSSVIELLRTGVIRDRNLKITRSMLDEYVTNFKEGAYGSELRVTVGHKRDNGGDDEAAGWITNLHIEESDGFDRLMGTVDWTDLGTEKIRQKRFRYVSSELAPRYPHARKEGEIAKNVFMGAALTNSPALKNQKAISLSEDEKKLIQLTHMFKKYIEELKAREKISKADAAFARQMLSDLPEEEQKTAEPDVADLEKKAEEDEKDEEKKETEEKKEEGEKKEEKKEDLNDKNEHVSLTEHNKLKEEFLALQEKAEAKELSEQAESVVLSDKCSTGLPTESKNDAVDFMKGLTGDQRQAFLSLMGKVQHVDLSVRGGSSDESVTLSGDAQEKTVQLAGKIFKEAKASGKEISMAEAQKMATEQLSGKSN